MVKIYTERWSLFIHLGLFNFSAFCHNEKNSKITLSDVGGGGTCPPLDPPMSEPDRKTQNNMPGAHLHLISLHVRHHGECFMQSPRALYSTNSNALRYQSISNSIQFRIHPWKTKSTPKTSVAVTHGETEKGKENWKRHDKKETGL